jgi:hypothetical protein
MHDSVEVTMQGDVIKCMAFLSPNVGLANAVDTNSP